MFKAIREQSDWLRDHADLLNNTRPRRDVLLFLPFRRWLDTEKCAASDIAAVLTKSNVQYEVICEDALTAESLTRSQTFLVEDRAVLNETETKLVAGFEQQGGKVIVANEPTWPDKLREAIPSPSLRIDGPPEVRGVVRDAEGLTVVHLYNLNVKRLSSFEDEVRPTGRVGISVSVPFERIASVTYSTTDGDAKDEVMKFTATTAESKIRVEFEVPNLEVSGMIFVRSGN